MPLDQLSDVTNFQLLDAIELPLNKQAKETINNAQKIMNKRSSDVSVVQNHLSSSLVLLG